MDAGQAVLGGAHGAVELGAEPGQERLPVGWQVEAPLDGVAYERSSV